MFEKSIEKLNRLLSDISAVTIVVLVVIIGSTWGWRYTPAYNIKIDSKSVELEKNLRQHVYILSSEIGDRNVTTQYANLNEAKKYISEQLSSFGYNPNFQVHKAYDKEVSNIIAQKASASPDQEIIIIGAHYDTCYNPGADDNASGIAAVLELARLFKDKNTKKNIRFIAFVNEEPPFFMTPRMGSRVYAKKLRNDNEKIGEIIIFEMIGYYSNKLFSQRYPPFIGSFYPNRANFIAVVGNIKSRNLVKKVKDIFEKKSLFPVEGLAAPEIVIPITYSDHWSFWKEGYEAIMITDTAFYRRISTYHRQSDTYEKLNYPQMAEVVNAMSKVLVELSN